MRARLQRGRGRAAGNGPRFGVCCAIPPIVEPGKTELRPRQRITRPLRQRKGLPNRDSAGHERPRAEWIPIPVPALVSDVVPCYLQKEPARKLVNLTKIPVAYLSAEGGYHRVFDHCLAKWLN